MLTQKQVSEIKEHLNKSQNPIFFFDNDPDGLCSFLLLQSYIERGKGVPVRSFPDLNLSYFRKVIELKADYIFILDKPIVSKEFFKEAEKINIPVVWIDHHKIDGFEIPRFVNYYNPVFNISETNEPVTALCYQISQKKEDLWISVIGSVSDGFVPDYYADFESQYPDLSIKSRNAFNILFKSQAGKIARIFSFALKDRTTNVINMLKFLMKIKNPYEVLNENSNNHTMHKRFEEINKKFQRLLEKAIKTTNQKKILFFQYAGELSISSDLANELSYRFPDKIIIVAYIKGAKVNISVRGKKIRDIILNSIKDIEGATGGGHEDAVGIQIKAGDIENFRKKIEELNY